jgi:putative membrane protein
MPHSCVTASISCLRSIEKSLRTELRWVHPADTIPSMDKPAEQDPRVYFAAERTFLAWIRTGLGLMAVGFAVSRFGLFLRELSAGASHLPARTTGLSLWSGVMLVVLGVIVTLSAVVRHFQLVRELRSGSWRAGRVSTDAVILALVLAAMGIAMASISLWFVDGVPR